MHNLHSNDLRPNREINTERIHIMDQTRALIADWERLKERSGGEKIAQERLEISRATYYRRKKALADMLQGTWMPSSRRPKHTRMRCWGEHQRELILKIRQENPTYGKRKIAVILRRDHGQTLSESTVGRILHLLMESGLVTKSISAPPKKKGRTFNGHAQPWTFKLYENMGLGERVQIDHMTVVKNGLEIKEFHAWERKSKHLSADIFSSATSSDARNFLLELVKTAPYPILSFQVDGGSEFRGEFEKACEELQSPLIVLPRACPKYNGGVERSNRTLREEFYARDDVNASSLEDMQLELKKAIQKYNEYRPQGLRMRFFKYMKSWRNAVN
jgi:Fe2+ or Zn2+ uptake regulation protein